MEEEGGLQLNIIGLEPSPKKRKEPQSEKKTKTPQKKIKTEVNQESKLSTSTTKNSEDTSTSIQTEKAASKLKKQSSTPKPTPTKEPPKTVKKAPINKKTTPIQTQPARENPNVKPLSSHKPEASIHIYENESGIFSKLKYEEYGKEVGIHENIIKSVTEKLHIESPTVVQRRGIKEIIKAHEEGKDVLLKAITGSGKTLAYLIPIFHLISSPTKRIVRTDGTFAIIIAPTRELSVQIFETAQKLSFGIPWVVPGLLIGGENRQKEKSRLRKGISILVATPGRLLDHLKSTTSFLYSSLQFIVLDEADRLMDMGFEKDLHTIFTIIRANVPSSDSTSATPSSSSSSSAHNLQSLLISATLNEKVDKLAGFVLQNPIFIYDRLSNPSKSLESTDSNSNESKDENKGEGAKEEGKEMEISGDKEIFGIPPGLKQQFIVVPTKRRLVHLASILRFYSITMPQSKIIVFMSNCETVEYHHSLFNHVQAPVESSQATVTRDKQQPSITKEAQDDSEIEEEEEEEAIERLQQDMNNSNKGNELQSMMKGGFLPNHVRLYKLHGKMSQLERSKIFSEFKYANTSNKKKAEKSKESSEEEKETKKKKEKHNKEGTMILFCTDVAARGMDIPGVDLIIQYDPPTVDDAKEYIHRVGRTARIGNTGLSLLFLMPHEVQYVTVLSSTCNMQIEEVSTEGVMNALFKVDPGYLQSVSNAASAVTRKLKLHSTTKRNKKNYELAAIDLQICFENLILQDRELAEKAKKSFLSFIKAYSTHSKASRHIFNFNAIHLGHLAKSFGLRDTPSSLKVLTYSVAELMHAKGKVNPAEKKPFQKQQRLEKNNYRDKMNSHKKFKEYSVSSEFSSGI